MSLEMLVTAAFQALVTFREGVEIALIVAMLLAILTQAGRRDQHGAVWAGVAVSGVVCAIAAIAAFALVGELEGSTAMLVEGIVMVAAAGVMTWMLVWMRRHARAIRGHLANGLAIATTSVAVFLFAATAVVREGFETVMILLAAGGQSTPPVLVATAAATGFAAAAMLGVFVYRRGMRMDYARFFRLTGYVLVAFATYSLAYGMHEFVELLAPPEFLELAIGLGIPGAYLGLMLRWLFADERRTASAATSAPTGVMPVAT